ncbi:triphosphoribosyl-dephospho-CoA synthase [Pyrococcus abyssi]|uniref:ATP: dephospho-CoA triphosphoribosyl transferase n=1 Tax=Pyrococcus abyssi (strain GE5 / Orsay) TaxID=272844 RepID=Q9V1F6_PYRAB|nr:triphosphoribosyl-dephospho-CoA synthase [Pyrococcus abyssi]CAB49393.1 Putative ATP:dephospho-coA triphosphoribosyl transferase, citG family [Pyrococcus abyssi GE5]CCE69854.1 TPA: ATP: dephospho-CoA triphosphoribosyl transferase [Pyrococcus abyssi GE5]
MARKENIVRAFILGPLIEVTVPKPGNVSRARDFEDLTIYHFLFANTSLISPYLKAVERGILLKRGKIKEDEVGIGKLMREAVSWAKKYQDANPNFGIIALSVPLLIALGEGYDVHSCGRRAMELITNSTPFDSVELYKAIRIANPKGVKRGVKYDVYDDSSFNELVRDNINLAKLAELSCARELIFCEWINGYSKVYEALSLLERELSSLSLEDSVVRVFLYMLAKYRDTLIERKAGVEEAELVRQKANLVLAGKMSLDEFHKFMREKGDLRNPGSIADILAVSLSLLLLKDYRLIGTRLVMSSI